MINWIIFTIWFFLPAGVANVTPIVAAKLPQIRRYVYPLDFHRTLRGRRILGAHKTVRGIVTGIIMAVITSLVQQQLYQFNVADIRHFIPIAYTVLNPALFGFLLGLGALGGDAAESFLKRQIGIRPGKAWFPFDQIDYILGSMLLTFFYIRLSVTAYVLGLIIWFLMHIIFSAIGYLFKLKKNPL
jgi:CDP-2,3-bis-(O-geranylgeranyl)-sn-glycerol synthase